MLTQLPAANYASPGFCPVWFYLRKLVISICGTSVSSKVIPLCPGSHVLEVLSSQNSPAAPPILSSAVFFWLLIFFFHTILFMSYIFIFPADTGQQFHCLPLLSQTATSLLPFFSLAPVASLYSSGQKLPFPFYAGT